MSQVKRRTMLGGLLLTSAVAPDFALANDPAAVRNALPTPGDFLVSAESENGTTPIKISDLKPGGDPTLAWAFDPDAKLPRDGSRLNQVVLMRFDPASLGPAEAKWAAQGVVAFSAICTHQGCTVTDWITAKQVLQCPCHQSEYDPRHLAKVVGGPAPRALPALPLKLQGSVLVVAEKLTDRVGGEPQRTT